MILAAKDASMKPPKDGVSCAWQGTGEPTPLLIASEAVILLGYPDTQCRVKKFSGLDFLRSPLAIKQ